jgi:hypothetical protein
MSTTTLEPGRHSKFTTDGGRIGCDDGFRADRAPLALSELTTELTTALTDAYWSFMLKAELEEAFDSALLHAAIAETPTLSGRALAWAN